MRLFVPLALLLLAAGCRSYERYGYVTSEMGLIPPDEYARYGPDQATAVAIGRAFGAAFGGLNPAAYAKQAGAAMTYAHTLPQVKAISADTLGHRLVVTFASGWTTQVTPIMDGVKPTDTPNLPRAK